MKKIIPSAQDNAYLEVKNNSLETHIVVKEGNPPQKHSLNTEQNKIGVSKGFTKSLGNYEFARVDIWIESNIEGDIEETYAKLFEQVDKELEKQLEELS